MEKISVQQVHEILREELTMVDSIFLADQFSFNGQELSLSKKLPGPLEPKSNLFKGRPPVLTTKALDAILDLGATLLGKLLYPDSPQEALRVALSFETYNSGLKKKRIHPGDTLNIKLWFKDKQILVELDHVPLTENSAWRRTGHCTNFNPARAHI